MLNSETASREQIRSLIKKAYESLPPIQTSEDFYDEYFWNDAETIQTDAQMIWYREYSWFVSLEEGTIYKAAKCDIAYPQG